MTDTTTRTWTSVGERFAEKRAVIERVIAGLTWESVEGDKPMVPALGLKACIQMLKLPRVSRVAIDGSFDFHDPPDGTAHYAVYGIECHYSNGAARVFVVDEGSGLTPVCSDFPITDAVDYETGQARR